MKPPHNLLSRSWHRKLHRSLVLCGLTCFGNFWLARFLDTEPDDPGALGLFALLLVLPGIQRLLSKRNSGKGVWSSWRSYLTFAFQLWLLTVLPMNGVADGLLVLSTWLAMHFVWRPTQVVAAALLVGITPLQTMAGMGAAPSPAWLFGFPLALTTSSLALVLLSKRYHMERVQSLAAGVHLRGWLKGSTTENNEPTRYAPAIALALIALLATVLAYPAMVALPRPFFNPRSPSLDGAASANSSVQEQTAARTTPGNDGSLGEFPGDIRPGGKLGHLTYETLMTIQAFASSGPRKPRNVGPLYVRALCLDTFTETGLRTAPGRQLTRVQDGDDGRQDGWIELNQELPETGIELHVRHNILRVRGTETAVLFAPRPARSLQLAEVQYNPDHMLALPPQLDLAEIEFVVRLGRQPLAGDERFAPEKLELSCAHPDERFLQLPPENDDSRWMRGVARRWVSSARTDLERVEQIVGHLQSDFGYSTKTGDVPGTQGIAQFMRRRTGHCTSFAAAAVFLLRSLKIPARVATGFLADEYVPEFEHYNISRKNGHAWIEVHFEGLGWQRFDPTPSTARGAALRAAEAGDDDGLPEWAKEFAGDLAAWARSGADEAYFAQLLATLFDAPRACAASIQRQPTWTVAGLFALFLLGVLHRGRKRKREPTASGRRSGSLAIYQRWINATQERFGPKKPSQTLREWTCSLQVPTGSGAEQLSEIVRLFNRARFGHGKLTQADEDLISAWIMRLEAPVPPAPNN